jgi:hypothetical protein
VHQPVTHADDGAPRYFGVAIPERKYVLGAQ